MFMDKRKNKFAIIQTYYYKRMDSTGVTEVIYNKKNKRKVITNNVGLYVGRPNVKNTWSWYKLHLNVNGRDPDVEYLTEEQYKECWDTKCEVKSEYFLDDRFKNFMIFEQNHYGKKKRKIKNPENRYLQKNIPHYTYFPDVEVLIRKDWEQKRNNILRNKK